jgi:CHAT domain-containing protein
MLRTARFGISLLERHVSYLFSCVFLCAVLIVTPGLGQTDKAPSAPSRIFVSPTPGSIPTNTAASRANVSKIEDLAFRIAAATTEDAADTILAADPGYAGPDLARAIVSEMIRLRNANESGEKILTVGLRLVRFTKRPEMAAALAIAHRGLGIAYGQMNRSDIAEKELLAAVNLFRRTGEPGGQDLVWTLRDLAVLYERRHDTPRTIEYYEKVGQLGEAIRDKDSVAQAYNGLAALYSHSGDLSKAYQYLDMSLNATDGIKDNALKLASLERLASAFTNQGRIVKAADAYDTAYQTAVELNSPTSADYLYESAVARIKLGDLVAAYTRFRKLEVETAANPDRRLYAYSLLNIAWIYKRHAQEKKALELYERTISLADIEIIKGSEFALLVFVPLRVEAVNRLAEIRATEGDPATALRLYNENLKTLRSVTVGSVVGPRTYQRGPYANAILEIEINTSLGELHSSLGNNSDASANFAAALAVAQKVGYETGSIDTLLSMATHSARLGDPQKAFAQVNAVQLLVQKSGRLDQLLKLRTITAAVLLKLNRPAAADLAFQEALRISESLRTDVTMPDQRASYFASLFAPFDDYIDFLMDRHAKEPDAGFDGKAFNVSERRRARALLDSLKVARADIRQGVEPALLEQESRIRNQLNSAAREQFSTIDRQFRPIGGDDSNVIRPIPPKGDITLLTAELARVETAIRRQSPRYAELMQPRPLRWGAMQTLLDEKTVLLNYTLGSKRSYLWTITQDRISSFVLPPRDQIEALVKTAYEEMSEGPEADSPLFAPAAETLSRILLEPAIDTIGEKRIVVVADGALQYLPFSSLPDPRTLATINKSPILKSNAVQFAPSASVVAVLRQEAERRPPPPSAVAIFADPVFSADDERFEGQKDESPNALQAAESLITRDLIDVSILSEENTTDPLRIPRLPFSRREADEIFSSAPPGMSFKALDFEASREKFASIDLSKYGIVHFATHGILHSEHPELSGVVLSLFNEKGEPVNGFLRLNEIYNMKLNADLVVLSACQTALGKEVRGEGLIGLTRGFMYAGSPRVLASLWKVDDVATAELMKIFYQKMLKEKLRPAAALRAAKIRMMEQKRWRSPYYWAAFELQGEWR